MEKLKTEVSGNSKTKSPPGRPLITRGKLRLVYIFQARES